MAKIYFNRLILGSITITDIPEYYMEAVKDYGKEYVRKGSLPIAAYELLFHEEYVG